MMNSNDKINDRVIMNYDNNLNIDTTYQHQYHIPQNKNVDSPSHLVIKILKKRAKRTYVGILLEHWSKHIFSHEVL